MFYKTQPTDIHNIVMQQPSLSERGEEPQWCSSKGGVCFETIKKVLIEIAKCNGYYRSQVGKPPC